MPNALVSTALSCICRTNYMILSILCAYRINLSVLIGRLVTKGAKLSFPVRSMDVREKATEAQRHRGSLILLSKAAQLFVLSCLRASVVNNIALKLQRHKNAKNFTGILWPT